MSILKIAVVTPVGPNTNPQHLGICERSVAAQSHPCDHFTIADGDFPGCFIELPQSADDIGSTPRGLGTAYAFAQGYDAVAWLDADNWFHENHIQRLVRHHHDTGKPVVCSGRYVCDVNGEQGRLCVEMVPSQKFWDTNTAMVFKQAKHVNLRWLVLDKKHHIIGDRIVLGAADAEGLLSCHYEPTVFYRSRLAFHYKKYGWDQTGVELETKTYSATTSPPTPSTSP